jgi:tetratricopeptide (TPR) repeat protein
LAPYATCLGKEGRLDPIGTPSGGFDDTATADASRPSPERVFVGREHELADLIGSLGEALAAHGRLVLLSGEPGIGKSRLADELSSHARDRGVRVLWGRCWEVGGAPAYWPWVQALRAYLRSTAADLVLEQMGTGAAVIAQMLPEIRDLFPDVPPPPSVDPESARFQLFDSTATFITDAAGANPLLLILEDLHAADTPSLLLLRFLASQLSDSPILVIGTYRDVELSPDHPLSETISELSRQPVTRRIALRGLGEDEVARFVEAVAGTGVERSLATALYRQTNGNPLFLGESVRLLVAGGAGDVEKALSTRMVVPVGVRDVIARRVAELSEACRGALVLASVLGAEFAIEPVRRLGELSAEELLEMLDEAVRAGLLAEVPAVLGRFRFSHALVREALYDALTPSRRIRLHRLTAEILEDVYGDEVEDHLAELAHHFFQGAPGGESRRAVEFARRAGDRAVAALAYEEAARLYEMGVQALGMDEHPDQRTLGELLLSVGDAQARAGELSTARETFLRAATIARRAGVAGQLALAALGYGGRFIWARAGNDPHLVPMLQDALVLLGGEDDPLRVRLLSRLSCALRSSPDRERSAALSQQALDIARTLDDPSTLAYALIGRFGAVWWPENVQERLQIADELMLAGKRADDAERIVDARLAAFVTMLDLADASAARRELAEMIRSAENLRQPAQRWLMTAYQANMALLEGSFQSAERLALEAMRGMPTPARDNMSHGRFHLFIIRREQGRLAEMEETLRSSIEEFPWYPIFRCALLCLLLDLDRRDEARVLFDELATDDFAALYRDNEWLLGISMASEACAQLVDSGAAASLYEQLLPFAGRHSVGHAEGTVGAVDRYLGLLAQTLGRVQDAEEHFQHSIAVNQRMGARPWVAHTEHDYARMLLERDGPGGRERALDLLAPCLETARELGMVALRTTVEALLGSLGGAPSGLVTPTARPPSGASVFRREGEYFTIVFEHDAFRLRDSKGLRFLALLLASPGKEFHALDLTAAETGTSAETTTAAASEGLGFGPGDAGEVLDQQAKAAYKRRLMELEEEIEEAEEFGDVERAARGKEERDFLAQELASAMGIGGRSRVAASAAERARLNVTRAIRSALLRIGEHSPVLSQHLEATTRTGTFCSYTPDPTAQRLWQL